MTIVRTAGDKSYPFRLLPDELKDAHEEYLRTAGAGSYVCPTCHNNEHLPGAKFCMICGKSIQTCEGCVNEKADRDMDCCWNCNRNRRTTRRDQYRRRPEA